jgi:hypothetical protein
VVSTTLCCLDFVNGRLCRRQFALHCLDTAFQTVHFTRALGLKPRQRVLGLALNGVEALSYVMKIAGAIILKLRESSFGYGLDCPEALFQAFKFGVTLILKPGECSFGHVSQSENETIER